MQFLSIQRRTGTPQIAGFYTITGESLVVQIRWPGGGFVWNTPIAIHAQRRGHTQITPVVDSTRLAQIGLIGLTLLLLCQMRGCKRRISNE